MTLAAGTAVAINASSYVTPALAKSDDREAVALYERFSVSWAGVTNVITTDGSVSTVNAENGIYNSKDVFELDLEPITTGKVLGYYQDEADSNAYAGVFTVSGTTATGQADTQIDSNGDIRWPRVGQISSTKFIGCHSQGTTTNIAVILTVSGNSVSGGTLLNIGDFGTPISCVGVSNSYSAFFRSRTISGTRRPELILLGTSGATPTEADRDNISTKDIAASDEGHVHSLARVDNSRVAFTWHSSSAGASYVCVADLSGGAISFGSVLTLTNGGNEPVLTCPKSDKLVIFNATTGSDAQARVLDVSGTTVTETADTVDFDTGGAWDEPCAAIVRSGEIIVTSNGYATTISGAPATAVYGLSHSSAGLPGKIIV